MAAYTSPPGSPPGPQPRQPRVRTCWARSSIRRSRRPVAAALVGANSAAAVALGEIPGAPSEAAVALSV